MKHLVIPPRRRDLLLAGIAAGSLLLPSCGYGAVLTGIDVLDRAALQVKAPERVYLVAITRSANRLVAVGEHGVIIYSDNYGALWTQAVVPVDLTLTCVSFATPMIGWAAGHFGVVLKTLDGGETWQLQLNGIQANHLTVAAAQQAVAQNSPLPGVPHAIRRATLFTKEGPDKPFLSVLALTPHRVIAFGAYRMTMISNDGGKTWADWSLHIFDPFSHDIYDAEVIGGDIYLACEEGLLFRSSDDGDSFLSMNSAGSATLFGILGAVDGSIIVFGIAGVAFRSTDGGKTWTTIALATQNDITAGRVLDSGKIVLASEAGLVFISSDNGITFQLVEGLTADPIFDMEETSRRDLIFVGSAGVVQIPEQRLDTQPQE